MSGDPIAFLGVLFSEAAPADACHLARTLGSTFIAASVSPMFVHPCTSRSSIFMGLLSVVVRFLPLTMLHGRPPSLMLLLAYSSAQFGGMLGPESKSPMKLYTLGFSVWNASSARVSRASRATKSSPWGETMATSISLERFSPSSCWISTGVLSKTPAPNGTLASLITGVACRSVVLQGAKTSRPCTLSPTGTSHGRRFNG